MLGGITVELTTYQLAMDVNTRESLFTNYCMPLDSGTSNPAQIVETLLKSFGKTSSQVGFKYGCYY